MREMNPRKPWRALFLHAFSGPLPGWLCLGVVLLVMAAFGLAKGDLMWYLLVPSPLLAAVVWNLCTWLAAIVVKRTRQLRSGWFFFVAIVLALGGAAMIWPGWGADLGLIVLLTLLVLGFPATMVMFVIGRLLPHLPWRLDDVLGSLSLIALAYLQAFVLLPGLFRPREAEPAAGDDTDIDRSKC